MKNWLKGAAVAASVAALCGAAHAQIGGVPNDPVNDVFGVTDSTVQLIDVSPDERGVVSFPVMIEGEQYTVEMKPHSVRAENYRLIIQDETGELRDVEPGPVLTLRGVVPEIPGALAAGSLTLDRQSVTATIVMPDNRTYWIEPLSERVAGAEPDEHVVYRGDDVLPSEGSCGTPMQERMDEIANGGGGAKGDATAANRGGIQEAELAYDADYEYFLSRGGTVPGVEARINSITNTVNVQYENDVQIVHTITAIVVRTNPSDPYTSTSSFGRLSQFRDEWRFNQGSIQRDTAHLMTAVNIDGGTIGRAWDIGAICSTFDSYAFSQSDCCGSFAAATDLTAHELGHLWDGFHCTCSNPDYTMNPFITAANRFRPGVTIPDIVAYRNSRPCLDDFMPEPPGPFNLLSPADGAQVMSGTSLQLTWSESANVDSYRVFLDDDSDFSSPILNGASTINEVFTVSGFLLEPGTTYFWNIEAVNGDLVTGPNGGSRSFSTEPVEPECPEDVTGDGQIDVLDLNAILASFNQPASADPDADITDDGQIDVLDLNAVLAAFNTACP